MLSSLREIFNLHSACCIAVELTIEVTIFTLQRSRQVFGLDGVIVHRIFADLIPYGNGVAEWCHHLEGNLFDGIETLYRQVVRGVSAT